VNPQNAGGNAAGTVLGLVSALTFAWFGHASKQLGRTLTPLNISLAQNIVVFLALTPMLFIAQPAPALTSDWLWLVLLGVFTTAFMHQLYFYALNRLSASTCSGFVALEPVYAILFAALFLDEPVTLWVIVSGILIVGASCALLKCETHT
jgi:drug/metabolite transporter (DMT)-like permease